MKILYRQNLSDKKLVCDLANSGINNCYFKSIKQNSGEGNGKKKRHSHNGFEFHIMIEGSQIYETESGRFLLDGGKILAIPKGVPHGVLSSTYPIQKFAFTFSVDGRFTEGVRRECMIFQIPDRVRSNLDAMTELHKDLASGDLLIENCVFETVILLLKEIGMVKNREPLGDVYRKDNNEDERVELARQFIADNVEEPLQTGEVAAYCYISEKQLNRLFLTDVEMTVAAYIRRQRLLRIEELLSSTKMSLSKISQRMGFSNEHSFNVFFKKHNGMPPGEYRKMTKNGKG